MCCDSTRVCTICFFTVVHIGYFVFSEECVDIRCMMTRFGSYITTV